MVAPAVPTPVSTDAPNIDTSISTSEPNAPSSGASALTPEQQDAANIEKELGINPYTLQPTPADDGEETEGAGDETETGDTAAVPSTADADTEFELTDEQVDALLEAIPEEKLFGRPKLKDRFVPAESVNETIQTSIERRQQATTVAEETQALISRGATAMKTTVDSVKRSVEALKLGAAELQKAAANQEFDPAVIGAIDLDPDKITNQFREFGTAVVLDTRRGYDNAFTAAFKAGEATVAPFTDEEKQAIVKIVQAADRIENDPEQGPDAAKSHLMVESIKYIVTRAKEAGRQEAITEIATRREAVKKVVGQDGVLAAATAKLAKTRKGLPPSPIAKPATSEGESGNTMDSYDAAVKAGNFDLADQIAANMAQTQGVRR